jgi:2-methylcitrate dehydratase PrpD
VIHPGSPIVPAALALGELSGATGAQVLDAVVLGMEVALRVGLAAGHGHFDRGWHLTGTAGHFGAAAAAARLLGLDAGRTAAALGIAGTQVAGLQVALGSMTKAFHPGKAAANGVEAALLAERGLTAPPKVVEGRRGFLEVSAPEPDAALVTAELGERWEAEANAIKPYACGIVSHPALDAAVGLRGRVPLAAIRRIVARVNPVVLDVMGVKDPRDGLQSKFSVYHCVAVGLIDGAGSPLQFSDARAVDPEVRRVRARVDAELDPEMSRDAANLTVELRDGTVVEEAVEHARGSAARPLTDADLRAKAAALTAADPDDARVADLMDLALAVDELDGLAPLVAAAARYAA